MRTKPIPEELLAQLLSNDFKTLFWSHVEIKGPDDCWNWTLRKAKNGYGLLTFKRKPIIRGFLVHRLAWILTHKYVPDNKCILHSCIGNRVCCNPNHLRPGTQKENMQEMTDQGRRVVTPGELAYSAKLTDSDIPKIMELKANGMSQHSIARMFNVKQPTIGRIIRGEGWKHLLRHQPEPSSCQPKESVNWSSMSESTRST